MRSRLIGCALALAILAGVAATPAAATHSEGTGPGGDFVYGTGSIFVFLPPFGAFDVQLHVNARIDDTGAARGRFWTELEGALTVDLRGTVTCLNVEGHHATVSGRINRSSIGFPPVGSGILAFGVDRGEGSKGGGDSVLGIPIGAPLANCPPAVSDGVLIEGGNFVAHDSAPT